MIRIGDSLILNDDNHDSLQEVDLTDVCPLTCGLSLRATVTASSIQDTGFTYCLQRGMMTLSGLELAPQEFNVSWRKKPEDLYPYLEVVTLLLLCDVSVDVISHLQF